MSLMMPMVISRVSHKRRCSHLPSPFSFSFVRAVKLLIFLAALVDRTREAWVRAQLDNDYCYDDLYLSDGNGDGKIDAEEYVEFCRLRLEQRLELSQEGYTYDTSSATITSFVLLPSGLQSNFYTLACLCSRFEFDDTISDKSQCCVGDNAHLSVVSFNNTVDIDEDVGAEELMYLNLVCSFSNRAIDSVVNMMEIVQPPTTNSPALTETTIPTTAPTALQGTTAPTIAPTKVPPTVRPTARPSMRTVQPTITPSTIPHTILPTASPSTRALDPAIAPTSHPSISTTSTQFSPISTPSTQPTAIPSTVSSASVSSITTIEPTSPKASVQLTNITIKTSYSILVEEQEQMSVDDVFDIRDDCIEAMNILASKVSAQLLFDGDDILEKTVFYDRLFVELPTAVDLIEEVGFTSTPELVEKDFFSDDTHGENGKNDKIFAGGPCPVEMKYKEDESAQYSCLDVRASILLKVMIEDDLIEVNITADDVRDLYAESLQREIMLGGLTHILENNFVNSVVIMATGQIVSQNANATKQPEGPAISAGAIVGLVAGVLLLVLILVIFRRKKQSHPGDDKETAINHFASADTVVEEDLEAKSSPGSKGTGSNKTTSSSIQSKDWRQQQHQHSVTNLLMSKPVPYFQTDTFPGSPASAEDAKSTGCISAESDAGWSEAYTSSMGSVSDDGVCDSDSPFSSGSPSRPSTMMSLSAGPTMTDIETKDIHGVSPLRDNKLPGSANPSTPTSPNSDTPMIPISPITPKSIQLLEETTSEDEKIMIHEDFSDEDDDENNDAINESNNKESPEDFRAKVLALIERIVPEEIDQIDDMMSQFKNREDELVETLLAMEKRALAQKQRDALSPPSSPERE